jgi:hypothetical protein
MLQDEAVGTQLVAAPHVGVMIGGGEHHDWDARRPGRFPNPTQDLPTIDAGHFEIQEDDTGSCRSIRAIGIQSECFEGFLPIARHFDRSPEARAFQGAHGDVAFIAIIFDE